MNYYILLNVATTRHILDDDGPVFLGVKRALCGRIGGEWGVGDRLPPVRDLARELGVGQNSAHRAVRELVHEGVLFSRRKLGIFVRQLPTAEVTGSRSAPLTGKTIGMAFHQSSLHAFVHRMIDGFREIVTAAGADTCAIPYEEYQGNASQVAGVHTLVLFSPSGDMRLPVGKQNIMVVSHAEHVNPELVSKFDSVGVDQYHGGTLAGRALRQAGCRSVCFLGRRVAIGTHRYDQTSSSRLHGFEQAWGTFLKDDQLLYAAGYSAMAGARRFASYMMMNPRPDGIFAASDDLAIGFVAAAAAHGLVAGRDFQLVGFDGQDRTMSESAGIELTTVRIPARQMGVRAAEMLLRRIEQPGSHPQRLLLCCSMSHGNTTTRSACEDASEHRSL